MADDHRHPTANGSASSWTASGATSAWQCVDDETPNDDTDTIYPTVNGQQALFAFSAFGIPAGAVVSSLDVTYRHKKTGSSAANIHSVLKVGDTVYHSTDGGVNPTNGVWNDRTYQYTTNPKSATAWTADDINGSGTNALQEFGVDTTDITPRVYCTQVFATVNYTAETQTPVSGSVTATGAPSVSKIDAVVLPGVAASAGALTTKFANLWTVGITAVADAYGQAVKTGNQVLGQVTGFVAASVTRISALNLPTVSGYGTSVVGKTVGLVRSAAALGVATASKTRTLVQVVTATGSALLTRAISLVQGPVSVSVGAGLARLVGLVHSVIATANSLGQQLKTKYVTGSVTAVAATTLTTLTSLIRSLVATATAIGQQVKGRFVTGSVVANVVATVGRMASLTGSPVYAMANATLAKLVGLIRSISATAAAIGQQIKGQFITGSVTAVASASLSRIMSLIVPAATAVATPTRSLFIALLKTLDAIATATGSQLKSGTNAVEGAATAVATATVTRAISVVHLLTAVATAMLARLISLFQTLGAIGTATVQAIKVKTVQGTATCLAILNGVRAIGLIRPASASAFVLLVKTLSLTRSATASITILAQKTIAFIKVITSTSQAVSYRMASLVRSATATGGATLLRLIAQTQSILVSIVATCEREFTSGIRLVVGTVTAIVLPTLQRALSLTWHLDVLGSVSGLIQRLKSSVHAMVVVTASAGSTLFKRFLSTILPSLTGDLAGTDDLSGNMNGDQRLSGEQG